MRSKGVIVALIIVVAVGGFFLSSMSEDAATEKETIVMADTQFQTLWINNAIASFIIENGYGYPTEIKTITTPVYQQTLRTGELDVQLELWRFNLIDWYNEVTEEGTVIDLGPTYEESTQGWYVPRYVIEGDPERGIEPLAPDLKSVFDLPDYWEIFRDPEDPTKGRFTNSIIGWQCTDINDVKLEAYGLTDYYNGFYTGTSAALDAAIFGAYQRGEPIVFYYWEPTWLVGSLDLVRLEEPPYDAEVWAKLDMAKDGKIDPSELEEACAYESFAIHKGIHYSLQERAPEVVEFLEKMLVGTEPLNKACAYMEENDLHPDEVAIWYFENYQDRWRSWLPDDVESKVEAALIDAGAQL